MQAETEENRFSDEIATLGDRLAAAREARGLSVDERARRPGVRGETVRRREADAAEPRGNRKQMLAGFLGVGLSRRIDRLEALLSEVAA
jgi:transcriptional regulator with XRE-family HTH domain